MQRPVITAELDNLETTSPELEQILEKSPPSPKKVIACALCDHILANADDRYEILGAHEHEYANPFGLVHRFRCFRNALGCSIKGRHEYADTWFPGYMWRIATCGQCDTHIGWLFESSDSFYGLLVKKISTVELNNDE